MSTRFGDSTAALMAEAIQIALNYLDRSGEIDDYTETCQLLADSVAMMMRHGQRNRLVLANRAIAAFQRYRTTRTIDQSLPPERAHRC